MKRLIHRHAGTIAVHVLAVASCNMALGAAARAQGFEPPFTYQDNVKFGSAVAAVEHTQFESTQLGNAFTGHSTRLDIARFDHLYAPNIGIGIGFGYEHQDVLTTFNAGSTQSDGISVSPSVAFAAFDGKTILGVRGDLAYFWNDSTRGNGTVAGDYQSIRTIGTASLSHRAEKSLSFDTTIFIQGELAYSYLWYRANDYVETNGNVVNPQAIHTGTVITTANIGLSKYDPIGDMTYVLFGSASYNWQAHGSGKSLPPSAATVDTDGLRLGGGLQIKVGRKWFAGLRGSTTVLSDDYKIHSVAGSVGVSF